MTGDRQKALAEFKRMIVVICVAGIVFAGGALWFLSLEEALDLPMIVGTVIGVFLAVLLGCGLFAAAFFSDKSGHDHNVTDATRRNKLD